MIDWLKNSTLYLNKYKTDSEAAIISCYFNPHNSPYRKDAFDKFYKSVKHLDVYIIECVIGDTHPQLDVYDDPRIVTVKTESLLWHKESLLNILVNQLPHRYKYVFWLDCDVIFSNKNWLIDGVKELQAKNIVQPFEFCVHLDKNQDEPNFDLSAVHLTNYPNRINSKVWRSFCSNYVNNELWKNEVYDNHGHVGFAWGAKREILEQVPLYDKALIGGADHIIAHAATGQIGHSCITKAFVEEIDEINTWSKKFYDVVDGKIGYVPGDLYHIWHGDIEKREYLKRVQDFDKETKEIKKKDENGLYVGNDKYVKKYFKNREVVPTGNNFLDDDDGGIDPLELVEDILYMNALNDDDLTIDPNFQGFGGGDDGGAGSIGDWPVDSPADVPVEIHGHVYHEAPAPIDNSQDSTFTPDPVIYNNDGNLPTDSTGTFS